MDSWIEDSIWWHIYPLGFLGADKEANPDASHSTPRLRQLEPWLKYLVELGCNGLLLCPIFSSSTHGYDTIDHYTIDPRLGNQEDFQWLVASCKALGIRLVLDGVFNHVGRQFAPFEDVLVLKQESKYANWFHIDWHNTQNEDGFTYRNFEGHHQLVTLNHGNPEVVNYVAQVMSHWLDKGIDGWRLDAAYAPPQQFWKETIARIKTEFPHAWLLGEVIHGDYAHIAKLTTFPSLTQYELWKAIWSALNDRNFFELSHALNRHNQFLSALVPNVFLGNHDVTRIATQLKNSRHLDLTIAILFTVPGIPSIYAGDEQGFIGLKEHKAGGDDDIRRIFPDDPGGFLPQGWATHHKYQTMVRFRRDNAWITRARINVLKLTNKFFVYEVFSESRKIVVALNCGENPEAISEATVANLRLVFGAIAGKCLVEAQSTAVWSSH